MEESSTLGGIMIAFIKSIFSEDGQGSYSRVFSGLIVLFTLGWVTHVVYKIHAIPDLTGPSMFIGASVGCHYGINKINDFIKDSKLGQDKQ